MPHLDYLTYLSQIFWTITFFWVAYVVFFSIFLPQIYRSIRIRKLKLDFLFDKFVKSDYKTSFYNVWIQNYVDKLLEINFIFLNYLKALLNNKVSNLLLKVNVLKSTFNMLINEILFVYWAHGLGSSFSTTLHRLFFQDWKKFVMFRNERNLKPSDLYIK